MSGAVRRTSRDSGRVDRRQFIAGAGTFVAGSRPAACRGSPGPPLAADADAHARAPRRLPPAVAALGQAPAAASQTASRRHPRLRRAGTPPSPRPRARTPTPCSTPSGMLRPSGRAGYAALRDLPGGATPTAEEAHRRAVLMAARRARRGPGRRARADRGARLMSGPSARSSTSAPAASSTRAPRRTSATPTTRRTTPTRGRGGSACGPTGRACSPTPPTRPTTRAAPATGACRRSTSRSRRLHRTASACC